MIAPAARKNGAVATENTYIAIRTTISLDSTRVADYVVLNEIGELDPATVEYDGKIVRYGYCSDQSPYAVARKRVFADRQHPPTLFKRRIHHSFDFIGIARRRLFHVNVGEIHKLFPVDRQKLMRPLMTMIPNTLFKLIRPIQIASGIYGRLFRFGPRPDIFDSATDIDKTRRDQPQKIVGIMLELGVTPDQIRHRRTKPVRKILQYRLDGLSLSPSRPPKARAAAPGAVGYGHRKALILSRRPKSCLTASTVTDDRNALSVKFRTRLDPIHHSRIPPRPRADRTP